MEKVFSAIQENRSLSDNGEYLTYIRSVLNKPTLDGFKHHPSYNLILEHVGHSHGIDYVDIILKQTPEFVNYAENFRLNDIIGNLEHNIVGHPTFFNYNLFGKFSASTIRYIKIASDIKYLFGNIGQNIAEIGIGYGGQCLILDQIYSWKNYFLFDLDLPLQLASRYLEHFNLNSSYTCRTLNQHSGYKVFDLVISTVAFSELPSKLQLRYIEKVLSKSKRGYLLMNSGKPNSIFTGDFLTLEQLRQYLPPFEVLPDTPLSLPTNNYLIVWGHKK